MAESLPDQGERRHWEGVAEAWGRRRPERLWRRHTDRVNGGWVAARLPELPVGRILKTDLFDEAASDGLYPWLRPRARLVVGMDLSAATARTALAGAPGLAVTRADARTLPFADDSFDIIVSNSTLDHFRTEPEMMQSLCELRRVLRPGGELLLTLDNRANPVVAFRNAVPFGILQKLRIMPFYVGYTCGPRGLARRLAATGWEVREMGALLHCPRFLSIHLTQFLERRATPRAQARCLDWLHRFEKLAGWPTRYLTGSFITVRAVQKTGESHHVA